MKITVDLPEKDLRDICRITGIAKKGPAIRKLLDDALLLQRRAEISGKFISGEWGIDLADIEASKVSRMGANESPHERLESHFLVTDSRDRPEVGPCHPRSKGRIAERRGL